MNELAFEFDESARLELQFLFSSLSVVLDVYEIVSRLMNFFLIKYNLSIIIKIIKVNKNVIN